MSDNISKLQLNITTKWPADNYNIHVSQKTSDTCSLFAMEGQELYLVHWVYINSSFFRYFVLERSAIQELWENLHHRFFSFSQNQILRYFCLSVPNCSLIENIFAKHRFGNISAIIGLTFWLLVLLILLAAFYLITIGLIYQKLCSFKH